MKIKTEHLPKRCEICHQSDCFTADTLHCSRCNTAKVQTRASVVNVDTNVNRKRRPITLLGSLADRNNPADYLTPYNWFLAQEARSNLVRIEKQVKNWWKHDQVTGELIITPVVWSIISAILMVIIYIATGSFSFTLLVSACAAGILILGTIGTAIKWFLKKKEAMQILKDEKVATDEYISNLLYR